MLLTLEGRVTFTLKLGVHSTLCHGGVLLTLDSEAGVVFVGFAIVKNLCFNNAQKQN